MLSAALDQQRVEELIHRARIDVERIAAVNK
jgi:hypothetical protein